MACRHSDPSGEDSCDLNPSGMCRILSRQYVRASASRRKSLGACMRCPAPAIPGKTHCLNCGLKRAKYYRGKARVNPSTRICDYKNGAKRRGMRWGLSDIFASGLMRECCIFCGYKHKSNLNGIDRVNNSRGYIYGNVVPCCTACNLAKHTMGAENWFDFMRRLAKGTENVRERVREYLANQTTPTTNVLETQD